MISPSEIKIEKGIPKPNIRSKSEEWLKLFSAMDVGDSILLKGSSSGYGGYRARFANGFYKGKRIFSSAKVDKGYRIWRMK